MRRGPDFAEDYAAHPYWWDGCPPDDGAGDSLPKEADIVIVGSGYTGLHAALVTARAGRATVVVDAETPGWGCSTRNGGQMSTSVKPDFSALAKRHGETLATDILREGQASLDFTRDFIATEGIDAEFRAVGRFHGAHHQKALARLEQSLSAPNPGFRSDAYMVSNMNLAEEIGTTAYPGGAVFPHHASIDPAKYHAGLLALCRAAGVGGGPHPPPPPHQPTLAG
ncbi:FAD-binding oxidoreductase, partial [Sulfitobacter sp. D35]|uniref:NAD(P)/FAD-dependent oxidoreductase n=1 Tax=Sulfitobacter sp. D35 TaxID=3083252 RepID=UPI00296F5D97